MDIVWIGLQERLGLFAGLIIRVHEAGIVVLLRGARDAAQKRRVIHKKLGGQHASLVELFEKIAGGFGGLAERIVGARVLIGREIRAGLHEIQFVEVAISALEEMRGGIGLHHGSLLRRGSSLGVRGSLRVILRENHQRRKRARQQQARGDPQLRGRAIRVAWQIPRANRRPILRWYAVGIKFSPSSLAAEKALGARAFSILLEVYRNSLVACARLL